MTRCFVALEVSREIRDRMLKAVEPLRRVGADVKWTSAENLHMTLRFLGELAETDSLQAQLAARLKGMGGFEVRFAGLGRFPERGGDVRIVWVGAVGELAKLKELFLDRTNVTDIAALSGLTKLQELHLRGTRVTDLGPLEDRPELKIFR